MRVFRTLLAGVVIVGLAAAPAAAQGVGIKGGINLSKFSIDPEQDGVTLPYLYGPTGGVFATVGRGPVGLQLEALYSRKGSKVEAEGDEFQIKLDSIDIPLLVRFNGAPANDTTVFAVIGPTVGVNVRATQANSDGTKDDIKDDVEQINLGLSFGLGVESSAITLEGRYTHGFTNLDKTSDDKIRDRTVTFLLGFMF